VAGNKLYVNLSVFNLDAATEEERKLIHQVADLWKRMKTRDGIKVLCTSQRESRRRVFDYRKLLDSQKQQLNEMLDQLMIILCQDKFKLKEIGSS